MLNIRILTSARVDFVRAIAAHSSHRDKDKNQTEMTRLAEVTAFPKMSKAVEQNPDFDI